MLYTEPTDETDRNQTELQSPVGRGSFSFAVAKTTSFLPPAYNDYSSYWQAH